MNALVLAAGYATRLYPLTLNKAKPLLEVGGKPIIEWLFDNLASVTGLKTTYIVTNNKFAGDFQNWAKAYEDRHPGMQGERVVVPRKREQFERKVRQRIGLKAAFEYEAHGLRRPKEIFEQQTQSTLEERGA